jgi:hypothetical protein
VTASIVLGKSMDIRETVSSNKTMEKWHNEELHDYVACNVHQHEGW